MTRMAGISTEETTMTWTAVGVFVLTVAVPMRAEVPCAIFRNDRVKGTFVWVEGTLPPQVKPPKAVLNGRAWIKVSRKILESDGIVSSFDNVTSTINDARSFCEGYRTLLRVAAEAAQKQGGKPFETKTR